jgi:hypothetical protein
VPSGAGLLLIGDGDGRWLKAGTKVAVVVATLAMRRSRFFDGADGGAGEIAKANSTDAAAAVGHGFDVDRPPNPPLVLAGIALRGAGDGCRGGGARPRWRCFSGGAFGDGGLLIRLRRGIARLLGAPADRGRSVYTFRRFLCEPRAYLLNGRVNNLDYGSYGNGRAEGRFHRGDDFAAMNERRQIHP